MLIKSFLALSLFLVIGHIGLVHSATNATDKVAILYDDRFLLHDTGPKHPERSDRLKSVVDYLRSDYPSANRLYWPSFTLATKQSLKMVHTNSYLALVENEVGRIEKGTAMLSTGDTVISPNTLVAAKLAVGAGMAGVDEVMAGNARAAFALVRPPGHHATASRGMGFCVYNNVAIAVKHLQKKHGVKRVLIVDFDVHHGNGTQDIFDEDDSVFYFSAHQSPLYPGTGSSDEVGVGKGRGTTMNIEVPHMANESIILDAIEARLVPAMQRFKPEFIVVSAGFDSHAGDLLGGLGYSDAGYAAITKQLLAIAKPYAKQRMVFVLEGGYVPDFITHSVASIISELLGADQ